MDKSFINVFVKAVLLIVIIGCIGIIYNLISDEGVNAFKSFTPPNETLKNDPRTITSVNETKALWDSGNSLFIDARPYEDYLKGHISGAFPLPYNDLDEYYPKIIRLLDPSYRIITYCDGADCLSSLHVADFFNQQGFRQVNIFFGGWELWTAKGFPTDKGEAFK